MIISKVIITWEEGSLHWQESFRQVPQGATESWPRRETPWGGQVNMSSWHNTCQGPLPRLHLRLVFPRTGLMRLHLVDYLQCPSIVCSHEPRREFRIAKSAGFGAEFEGARKRRREFQDPHSLTLTRRSFRTVPPWFNLSLSRSFSIGVAAWFRRRSRRG